MLIESGHFDVIKEHKGKYIRNTFLFSYFIEKKTKNAFLFFFIRIIFNRWIKGFNNERLYETSL